MKKNNQYSTVFLSRKTKNALLIYYRAAFSLVAIFLFTSLFGQHNPAAQKTIHLSEGTIIISTDSLFNKQVLAMNIPLATSEKEKGVIVLTGSSRSAEKAMALTEKLASAKPRKRLAAEKKIQEKQKSYTSQISFRTPENQKNFHIRSLQQFLTVVNFQDHHKTGSIAFQKLHSTSIGYTRSSEGYFLKEGYQKISLTGFSLRGPPCISHRFVEKWTKRKKIIYSLHFAISLFLI